MTAFQTLKTHAVHGGTLRYLKHDSVATGTAMTLSVFVPPGEGPFPVLIWLSGLTCTEDNFTTKAGAYRAAAEHGVIIVAPDTSPRGEGVADDAAYDLGQGAGFYLDATQAPWATHWRMESYLVEELLPLVGTAFPVDLQRIGLFGHSMGGHGALTLGLRHPGRFKSISALAPICAPARCPWGEKAFTGYLGADRSAWGEHDATVLMENQPLAPYPAGILIDQGLADKFLEAQLHPHLFEAACAGVGQPLTLRRHEGYDHGYYFVQSFVADHLAHHAERLGVR